MVGILCFALAFACWRLTLGPNEKLTRFQIRILNAVLEPIGTARVAATSGERQRQHSWAAVGGGVYAGLHELGSGGADVLVSVTADGFVEQALTLGPFRRPLSEPVEQLGDIILEQEFVLAGRALDSQGKPVPNAGISVAGPTGKSTWNLPTVRKLRADGNGQFHVRGLQAGLFKVTGWADNPRLHGSRLIASSFPGSTGTLGLVLEEQSRIIVSVSAQDDSILAETVVFLVSRSKRVASAWNPGKFVVERADGFFDLGEASVSSNGLAFVVLPKGANPADINQVQAFARGGGWASSRLPVRPIGIGGECFLELHLSEEFPGFVKSKQGRSGTRTLLPDETPAAQEESDRKENGGRDLGQPVSNREEQRCTATIEPSMTGLGPWTGHVQTDKEISSKLGLVHRMRSFKVLVRTWGKENRAPDDCAVVLENPAHGLEVELHPKAMPVQTGALGKFRIDLALLELHVDFHDLAVDEDRELLFRVTSRSKSGVIVQRRKTLKGPGPWTAMVVPAGQVSVEIEDSMSGLQNNVSRLVQPVAGDLKLASPKKMTIDLR